MNRILSSLLKITFCLMCGCDEGVQEYPVSEATKKQEIASAFVNSSQSARAPYVVLVSIDGFRHDYAQRYGASHLLSFDVRAEGLIPSFPSKTFPNHYSIVTGLYPGNHGLVSNTFYDRSLGRIYEIGNRKEVEDPIWYKGKPIWALARAHGMVTASMMWVGTETPINGHYPTYYYKYNAGISHEDRVNTVVNWLLLPEEKRPHFITLYFSDTDDVGHEFGPDSEEIEKAVLKMNDVIGDLRTKLQDTGLPVQLVLVSDHGMKSFDVDRLIRLSELLPELPQGTVMTKSIPAMIYSSQKDFLDSCFDILSNDDRLDVYRKGNCPDHFHYRDDSRIGDLVIVPKPGFQISEQRDWVSGNSTHGYDPSATPDMNGIFYADGSFFRANHEIEAFENIHIYPLMAHILGLKFDTIDGDPEVLQWILK
ncbi:MAG: ectonucleotide pyrophosphatase/phosphodiesterase [Reichenbachiella sp.]|uniref:alkaline phosphatase family protein n=1 Tax=Reichenbachiella sp. TaxID=2184521 RepID=UPI0029661C91|nr:ectonucleotide pyrophosphatase/phosphodiesterase [Reichenbachiella sp.]MDW3209982.1 ectonucleotide pyrophosphatase/phosphodiesterase [Reichenbachiella sp.]